MCAGRLLIASLLFLSGLEADGQATLADLLEAPGTDLARPDDRARIVARMAEIQGAKRDRARAKAMAAGLPVRSETPGGRVFEIADFDGPQPLYLSTENANAAISTGANLLRVSPYSLSGSGVTIGMWDGGSGRSTHQEFGTRMVVKDGSPSVDHATHVGGTLAATGVVANARGMANAAVVDSYDWNGDLTEMTGRGATAAGQGGTRIYLSNHSYGYICGWNYVGNTGNPLRIWEWYGSGTDATSIEDDFGRYNSYSRDVDSLAFNAPYYLVFQSAGNERSDNPANGQAVALSPGSTTVVTYDAALHPKGDGSYRGGFESMGFRAVAKNVITVGATTDAVSSGLRSPSNANITAFSSWGPTDDGRIKPDVVANGDALYSSLNASNNAYGNYSGTSMSTPNACGSAALLVQQYGQLFPGQAMRAATLKGLLIHTADDRGNAGPDYKFGWGLVNVKAAADLLIDHHANPAKLRVSENQVSTSVTTRTHSFIWDGSSPIRTTLCWTDPSGTSTTTSDSRVAKLVNNLQLKLVAPNGTEYLPYVMPFVGNWTQASMDLPATTGTNDTDNVEQVLVSSPGATGTWRAVVSYSGTIANNQQNYSLLISGSSADEPPPPPLALSSVNPASALSNSSVTIDLTGTGLRADTAVKLTKSGQSDILATSVQLVGESLRCQLDLGGAAAGLWNVTVTNPDSSTSTLADAFTVVGSIWNESFDGPVSGWSSESGTGSNSWNLSALQSHSPGTCYFASAPATKTTTNLISPAIQVPANANSLQFKFWHYHILQSTRDAGKLEFSVNGGSWFDAGSSGSGTAFASNGYNATVNNTGSPSSRNEFAGQMAWSGDSGGYIETIVNLTDTAKFAGKSLRARWRIATNSSTSSTGWRVDSISLIGGGDLTNQPPSITTAATTGSTETETDTEGAVWRVERGATTTVSVAASDDTGEPGLSYTWSTTGPAPVFFSPNATNSAKTSAVEFQTTGDYTATVTVRDTQGLSVTSSVNLRVVQTASGLKVSPSVTSVTVGGIQSFAAVLNDQFGDPMANQPTSFTWSASGGGSINPSGLFTATTAGGPFAVTASSGGFSDFASVTVNPAAATVTLGGLSQTYTGSERIVTVTTSPPGLSVLTTYDGNPTPPVNAGIYQVEAVITDPNYQGSASGVLSVAKATSTVTLTALSQTYTGSERIVTVTTSPPGLSVLTTYDGNPTPPVNAGIYQIEAVTTDPNHQGSASGVLSVGKALATVSITGLTHVYDGNEKQATVTTDPAGLAVAVTYDGSTTPPTEVGDHAVIATVTDSNHEGSASATLVIEPANDYANWVENQFTAAQQLAGEADENADPEADGLTNLAEYALGTDPHGFTPPFTATLDANGLTLIFTRPSGLPDVTYAAESWDGLGEWTPVPLEVIAPGETETVRARDPLTAGQPPRKFIRLRFTRP